MGRQILIALGCLLVGLSAAPVQAVSLRAAFKSISTETAWPLSGTSPHDLESAFGPRIKESTDAYDWHPGVDMKAEEGTQVVAAVSGTLEEVVEFPNGGLTVILKHEFVQPVQFHGETAEFFYTYYMHLSEVDDGLVAASESGEHPVVVAGQVIGEAGHSGTAIGDHLHLEVRVGTTCSLSYQLEHPESNCARWGFDPQVNPLFLFGENVPEMSLYVLSSEAGKNQRVGFKSAEDKTLLNKIEWKVIQKPTGQTVHSRVINYNLRRGLEAGESNTFDAVDKTQLFISPRSWSQSAEWFRTTVVIPWVKVEPYQAAQYTHRLVVTDIWGHKRVKSWKVGE